MEHFAVSEVDNSAGARRLSRLSFIKLPVTLGRGWFAACGPPRQVMPRTRFVTLKLRMIRPQLPGWSKSVGASQYVALRRRGRALDSAILLVFDKSLTVKSSQPAATVLVLAEVISWKPTRDWSLLMS